MALTPKTVGTVGKSPGSRGVEGTVCSGPERGFPRPDGNAMILVGNFRGPQRADFGALGAFYGWADLLPKGRVSPSGEDGEPLSASTPDKFMRSLQNFSNS